MMLSSLTISLFYAHEEAGQWSLMDLARGHGVIATDDLGADDFLAAEGGIRFDHDRFHTFLRSGAAGDLRSYVFFLLETLVNLSKERLPDELERLRSNGVFEEETNVAAALIGEDGSRLVARKKDQAVELAFLDAGGKAPSTRLSPYFDGVAIPAALFKREAGIALDEFFAVAKERAKGSEGELAKLVAHWRAHKRKLI